VHVLVSDQGHTDAVAAVMRRYNDHPHVEHIRSEATCLAENWECAARHCDTPYFAWLQDDDVIARGVSARICASFRQFPGALHYQSRLYCSINEKVAAWWGSAGPWVQMNFLDGEVAQWPGEVLVPAMYLSSWALSPAVAFRCGEQFNRALDFMPVDADLMAERLILAVMGSQGPWIADPVLFGYWRHGTGNESYKQHHDQARQTQVMIGKLDELMDVTDWEPCFSQWLQCMSPLQVMGWLNGFECDASRHADSLRRVMAESLSGRVAAVPPPATATATAARDSGTGADNRDLVWC
jgi:glycosyl transferase family 2